MRYSHYRAAAGRLRDFRRLNSLKQSTIAEWLGISQAYYSRIEAGQQLPSHRLHLKITKMMEEQRFHLPFDRWRLAVRHSATKTGLIRDRNGLTELVDVSIGFRQLGGAFAAIEEGESVDGVFGEDADYQIACLREAGAFSGEMLMSECVWCSTGQSGPLYFKGISTAVCDDSNEVCLHICNEFISEQDYLCAVEEKRTFKVIHR